MSIPNLIEHVLHHVSPQVYYKLKFTDWDELPNTNVLCPYGEKHEKGKDTRPSFSLNVNDKGGCYCHACGTKVGSIIHFEKLASIEEKLDDETAASRIYSQCVRPVLAAPSEVEMFLSSSIGALGSAPLVIAKIKEELLITESTIHRFDLGWDIATRRVTIPVLDKFNQLVNTRLYRLPSMRANEKYPKILNSDGYGKPAEMFPALSISAVCKSKHRPAKVYWFSGERDTILAWDRGIPSFCYTTGENVCRKEWFADIAELNCIIGVVQDNDKAGIEGAVKRMEALIAAGIPCFLVALPSEESKDFSEFIHNGYTVQEFLEIGQGETKEPPKEAQKEGKDEGDFYEIIKVFNPMLLPNAGTYAVFDIGRKPELLNKPITVCATVSGKMERTYSVPYVYEVGDHKFKLPISREMLQMIRENDVNIGKLIKAWLNTKARITPRDKITITEVEIIPMIQPGVDTPYVNQKCYFFGELIECNKPYEMVIIPTTEMKSQETVGMIVSVKPVSNVLDAYKFEEAACDELMEAFNPAEGESLMANLYDLAQAVSINFTRIYHRNDLHVVTLLSWVCPLEFQFPMEGVQRGWLNTLVLGDTETGKSKICQKLTSLFHCGVFINAESCSYVGLVGGAVKSSSGMFLLRWGKIPLYNRQLVVVEELSGLTTEEISYMSEVRSSGVARYDKAGLSGETSAKTRLICLSNVRDKGKSLGDYNTGVQAALGLVGQNEDLARFDLILTATDEEVDGSIINKDRSDDMENSFSSIELKKFQDLVMFAWSLKHEQIDFTVGAYRACLQQTLLLSAKYHPSLPVFKAGSGRLKLARIALAIACIQMSWDKVKEKLVVKDVHVEAAAELLHCLYSKPSFGYLRYSIVQYNLQKVLNEEAVMAKVKSVFDGKEPEFYRYIGHSMAFSKFEVADAMGVHAMYVERIISQLFLSNLIKKGDKINEWTLSRAGRKWVEKQITHN